MCIGFAARVKQQKRQFGFKEQQAFVTYFEKPQFLDVVAGNLTGVNLQEFQLQDPLWSLTYKAL